MRSTKSWTTIIEAMIAMFIVIVWIIWVFTIYTKSQKLATSTENRIKAISIAREWIEAMQNIRDTNWILFWADPQNCWNVQDYNIWCLWDNLGNNKITPWDYKIYKDIDNRWKLISGNVASSLDYSSWAYRTDYEVKLDPNWLYTQSWWTWLIPIFTRKINISYPEDTNSDLAFNRLDEKMLVKSIVSWADNSKIWFYTVNLENLLTNWKKDD
jgi:hypothetical protein